MRIIARIEDPVVIKYDLDPRNADGKADPKNRFA
jgi:hypothetical protein